MLENRKREKQGPWILPPTSSDLSNMESAPDDLDDEYVIYLPDFPIGDTRLVAYKPLDEMSADMKMKGEVRIV